MKQGNIGVTTENIFPVIKKFLYSDHEIFIREIVSNAVDATQKLRDFGFRRFALSCPPFCRGIQADKGFQETEAKQGA